jgi:DNA-binding transcriptional MerR regulator
MVTRVRIGELANRAGVSIDAVRYYERRGVLPRADRTAAGYRVFADADVARLEMVRYLQALGFTLDEVVDALQAHDRGGATCESEQWRLDAVRQRIDVRIADLKRARRLIDRTLAACRSGHCGLTSARKRVSAATGASS